MFTVYLVHYSVVFSTFHIATVCAHGLQFVHMDYFRYSDFCVHLCHFVLVVPARLWIYSDELGTVPWLSG